MEPTPTHAATDELQLESLTRMGLEDFAPGTCICWLPDSGE